MRQAKILLGVLASLFSTAFGGRTVSAADRTEATRMVLVELYTSQGCDMCPTAEKILGALAETGPQDRADRLPCRLLQRSVEGRVLRPALQPAADGLQPALHQAQEPPSTGSTTRRCS